jgi:uncharacterized protein (DUF4415 family)
MSQRPEFDPDVEERLAALPEPDLDDPDNPEWTEEDFARARPLSDFPELHALMTNGADEARAVRDVTLTLPAEVVARYEAEGADWRDRMARLLAAPESRRRA